MTGAGDEYFWPAVCFGLAVGDPIALQVMAVKNILGVGRLFSILDKRVKTLILALVSGIPASVGIALVIEIRLQ